MSQKFIVRIPRELELENGEKVALGEDQIHRLDLACLTFSPRRLIVKLVDLGFRPVPAVFLGEIVSMGKMLTEYLEIHVRVFKQGIVLSEIEVSRSYIEHLMYDPVNGSYYLYELLRNNGFGDIKLIYRGKLVRAILSFYECEIVIEGCLHKMCELSRNILIALRDSIRQRISQSISSLHRAFYPHPLQAPDRLQD